MALETNAPQSKRAHNTRQRIIESAISLFADLGYEKATTKELAARAGVSEGLIYRYFAGKRELLFAALGAEQAKTGNEPAPIAPGLEP